jgi:hypothetical protein
MAKELPARPSLEQLKKQAKELLQRANQTQSFGLGCSLEASTIIY